MIYTFRTSPFKDELQKQFKEVFIFGSLKKDFEEFKRKIAESKPKYIIGIAKTKNINIVKNDPTKLAAIPAASGSRESAVLKNCQLKIVLI
jgi:hypothetical protein